MSSDELKPYITPFGIFVPSSVPGDDQIDALRYALQSTFVMDEDRVIDTIELPESLKQHISDYSSRGSEFDKQIATYVLERPYLIGKLARISSQSTEFEVREGKGFVRAVMGIHPNYELCLKDDLRFIFDFDSIQEGSVHRDSWCSIKNDSPFDVKVVIESLTEYSYASKLYSNEEYAHELKGCYMESDANSVRRSVWLPDRRQRTDEVSPTGSKGVLLISYRVEPMNPELLQFKPFYKVDRLEFETKGEGYVQLS